MEYYAILKAQEYLLAEPDTVVFYRAQRYIRQFYRDHMTART